MFSNVYAARLVTPFRLSDDLVSVTIGKLFVLPVFDSLLKY